MSPGSTNITNYFIGILEIEFRSLFVQPYVISMSGGLNENSSHWFLYLNTCFSVGRMIWKRLGGVMLLEELCHSGVGGI